MDISMETVPKVSENVKVREEQFGLLLVSKRTPILALNKDSAEIWGYFDGEKSVREISEAINLQIEGDLENTEEAVKCFTESCLDLGLIDI